MGEKARLFKGEWNLSVTWEKRLNLNRKVQLQKELTIEWIELGDCALTDALLRTVPGNPCNAIWATWGLLRIDLKPADSPLEDRSVQPSRVNHSCLLSSSDVRLIGNVPTVQSACSLWWITVVSRPTWALSDSSSSLSHAILRITASVPPFHHDLRS